MLYGKAEKAECQPVCKDGFHYGGKDGCTVVELGFALEWKEWLHYSVKGGWTIVERDKERQWLRYSFVLIWLGRVLWKRNSVRGEEGLR